MADAAWYARGKLQDALKLGRIEELLCDICGKHLGFVHEFDLNGSYFFCDECRTSALKNPSQ